MYRSEMYIDYNYVSYQGSNSNQKICFEIDSINRLKYWGHLIINEVDTIKISGFEKGGHYPTWYSNNENKLEMIDIWCWVKTAQIPEKIEISQRDSINGIIKIKTILQRQPRTKCR